MNTSEEADGDYVHLFATKNKITICVHAVFDNEQHVEYRRFGTCGPVYHMRLIGRHYQPLFCKSDKLTRALIAKGLPRFLTTPVASVDTVWSDIYTYIYNDKNKVDADESKCIAEAKYFINRAGMKLSEICRTYNIDMNEKTSVLDVGGAPGAFIDYCAH